ncbi:tetratricopeptide repeat protein [Vibrio sp. ZSDE26]|uniref:Tetratricopeptide repeat protein n=2 Tax=Vibrio amylolyticus TaxID=2847292 RepID=A0A9X1XJ21_9VIBR|nr:multiheme c-type cytochrome [Vibrio amylolyticus]MCK6262758.1 tetratricopeptide repeat protein [Vibrio amylolyticus]
MVQSFKALLALVVLFLFATYVHGSEHSVSKGVTTLANYVGSDSCIDCHQDQVTAWKGSHHDMAMKHATEDSVLADFDDHTFKHQGKPNRFFQKGDEFWVNIQGPDGQFQDYKISYTFAFEPLQQYMVEFDDGRVQLIPFAWDSRTKDEGGQRWFHLYPETTVTDEFYWTNTGQNWNFMCADCHSTNLKKNYDSESNTYNTTWSDINVGCEACHGPASEHIDLAKLNAANARSDKPFNAATHYGFSRDLSTAVTEWIYQENQTTLQPKEMNRTNQIQTCAQCHSRRTQLNETGDHIKGSFFDRYRLSLITPELYYHDGQIYDEDYVYGSFLQSKMAEKGVTCTNCHDPHSAKLKIDEKAVCSQCHIASEYTPEKHTFHQADTEASQCTTCHMPETTYMQVDPRRDHSWHVPRADISQHINTPNVCTACHEDKDAQWADEQVGEWFPNSKYRNQQHFSIAFYADAIGHRGAEDALAYTSQDSSVSDIIRASSLERMAGNTNQNTLISLARAVKHENEMLRLGAISGASGYELADRWQILEPLLSDPVLSVRAEAASTLVVDWASMTNAQKEALKPPLDEYIEIQTFNADRGFGRTNLGNVYRSMGQFELAISSYLGAIEIEPYFESSYVNLADLYRMQGDESHAMKTLKQGMEAQPKSSVIPYSLGLALLRAKDDSEARRLLKTAAEIAQQNSQYWYVYGLAMEREDVIISSEAIHKAYQLSGNPQHLYAQCEVLARNFQSGRIEFAFKQCMALLSEVVPPEVVSRLNALIKSR